MLHAASSTCTSFLRYSDTAITRAAAAHLSARVACACACACVSAFALVRRSWLASYLPGCLDRARAARLGVVGVVLIPAPPIPKTKHRPGGQPAEEREGTLEEEEGRGHDGTRGEERGRDGRGRRERGGSGGGEGGRRGTQGRGRRGEAGGEGRGREGRGGEHSVECIVRMQRRPSAAACSSRVQLHTARA